MLDVIIASSSNTIRLTSAGNRKPNSSLSWAFCFWRPAMDRAQYRRQMTGNMPTGEYRPGDMQFRISHKSIEESQINESDYEPDAWVAIQNSQQLWNIVQGWARK